jgi:MFS superfamily sulfate permease-like transporter
VLVFKPEESIYFANCEIFKKRLVKSYGACPIEIFEKQTSEIPEEDESDESAKKRIQIESAIRNVPVKSKMYPDIILDFSAVNYVDTNGISIITNIVEDFRKIDVSVYICQAQGAVA